MSSNHHEIFTKVDRLLSARPAMRLYELARRLQCSHPTIEKAVLEHTSLSFRKYQKIMLLQKSLFLLEQSYTVKAISFELGFKWPQNFPRFVKQNMGCPISELDAAQSVLALVAPPKSGGNRIFNK